MKLMKCQKVSASLTDYKANLSVLGVFQIMEDAVTEFMGDLKIDGLTAKREYNAVWVFAKSKIKFIKSIEWNKEYTVTCFISKISNVTINIDVVIKNAREELCAYSKTELCALDMNTGRIRRVSTVGVSENLAIEEPLTDITFTKIDTENLPIEDQVKIKFTNIDYAVHTNNVEYIRFILNTYTIDEMKTKPIREIEVLYLNQSFENDILTIHKGCFENKEVFSIEKEDKTIIKCEILHDN